MTPLILWACFSTLTGGQAHPGDLVSCPERPMILDTIESRRLNLSPQRFYFRQDRDGSWMLEVVE